MTRKVVERLIGLIARADALEDLARQVQDEASSDPMAILHQLRNDYGTWYADALAALPPELVDAFRKQYEGSFASYKIKHFLSSGLEINAIFSELAAQGVVSKWRCPADDSFSGPLLEQKQVLRNAAALAGGHRGTLTVLDELEETFRSLPVALAVLPTPGT